MSAATNSTRLSNEVRDKRHVARQAVELGDHEYGAALLALGERRLQLLPFSLRPLSTSTNVCQKESRHYPKVVPSAQSTKHVRERFYSAVRALATMEEGIEQRIEVAVSVLRPFGKHDADLLPEEFRSQFEHLRQLETKNITKTQAQAFAEEIFSFISDYAGSYKQFMEFLSVDRRLGCDKTATRRSSS